MKQYVAIIRDHSGSMNHLGKDAMNDYNLMLDSIKEGAQTTGIETIVTVVKCGVGTYGTVETDVQRVEHFCSSPHNTTSIIPKECFAFFQKGNTVISHVREIISTKLISPAS